MKCSPESFNQILRGVAPNLFAKPLGPSSWGDLNGALAGSIISIPQTLAYGLIIGSAIGGSFSGVGMIIAMYGAALLGLFAAVFGGCPFLVAGPRASTILIFTALIAQLSHSAAVSQSPEPASLALSLACMAVVCSGFLQLIFGALRLGQLANYVPFPVISGFVNGSALLIILSQVCPAMGISEQKSLLSFIRHVNEIKPATLALSLATAISILVLPRLIKRIPPIPFAFFVGTVVYQLFAYFGFAEALGGNVPPPPEHYTLHFIVGDAFAVLSGPLGAKLIPTLLAAALSMSILSSLETLFAAAATDEITLRRSNNGRQLMAEGFGNVLAGMFGMAPGSGSLSRTKAALSSGMNSVSAAIGIALITLFVAFALGSMIGLMSHAVMAGLLLALGIKLLDKRTLVSLRRYFFRSDEPTVSYSDMIVVTVVIVTALIADLTTAVGIGVLLSVLLFVTQMARNPVRRSYRATALIPRIYGDIARQRFLERYGKNIAVLEIDGILFFGTANELEAHVEKLANEAIVHVVLDMRRLKHVDASGARALERMNSRLSQMGGILAVGYVDKERRQTKVQVIGKDKREQSFYRDVWIKLADFGTIASIGKERFLTDTDSAVAFCEKHLALQISSTFASHELVSPHTPLMRSLDRPMLRRLRDYLTRVFYMPDEVLFLQGSAPDGAFFVASGRVDVLIDLPGTERKRKIQSVTAGSIFGEMALINPHPRSASIIAVEPTVCYYMSSGSFERMKIEQPDIAFALLNATAIIFADRLRATNKMLAEMEA